MSSSDDTAPQRGDVLAGLRARGFRPSARRGQNFLFDPQLLAALATDAGVESGETVLEIGCGAGTLTRELLARGCRVIGVEIDRILCEYLEEELGRDPAARFTLVRGDALATKNQLAEPLEAALAAAGARYRLVANLPYAIATPVVTLLVGRTAPAELRGMGVLVQRELAERWVAAPGSRDYGAASVLLQLAGSGRVTRGVGRQLFAPPPRVDSAFYAWSPRPDLDPARLAPVRELCRELFTGRRKMLRALLGSRLPAADPWWGEHRVDPRQRVEELSPEALEALAARLAGSRPDARSDR